MKLTHLEQATQMLSFEIVGLGFNGGTDATDDRILWVVASSRSALDTVLQNRPYREVNQLPFELTPEQIDFVLPEQASSLYEALRSFGPVSDCSEDIQEPEVIVSLSQLSRQRTSAACSAYRRAELAELVVTLSHGPNLGEPNTALEKAIALKPSDTYDLNSPTDKLI